MAGVTLQQFVVKLSYQIDEASVKRFKEMMDHSHRSLKEFRLALLGMAVGVEEAIRRTMNSFAQLHVTSRMTGVPAEMQSAFEHAFEAIGLSAGDARADVMALTQTLMEAGRRGQIVDFLGGQDFANAQEALDKIADKYAETVARFGKDSAEAHAQMQTLMRIPGVNWQHIRQMSEFTKERHAAMEGAHEIIRKMGLDEEKAAADAFKLQMSWNNLSFAVGAGIKKIVSDNFENIQFIVTKVTELLTDPEVLKVFQELATDIANMFRGEGAREAFIKDLRIVKDIIVGLIGFVRTLIWGFGKLADVVGPNWAVGIAAALAVFGPAMAGALISSIIGGIGSLVGGLATALFGPLLAAAAPFAATLAGIVATALGGAAIGIALGLAINKAIKGTKLDRALDWAAQQAADIWERGGVGEAEPGEGLSASARQRAKEAGLLGKKDEGLENKALRPNYQGGGIVNANVHHGEMVLPANISFGLQQMFSRSPSGQGFGGDDLASQFKRWWAGDSAFRPFVDLTANVYERLEDMMMIVWDLALKAMGHKGLFGEGTDGESKPGSGSGSGSGSSGAAGDDAKPGTAGAPGAASREGDTGQIPGVKRPENAAIVAKVLEEAGIPRAGIAGVLGWMHSESGFNPSIENASHHKGLMQWDQGRWKQYLTKFLPEHGGEKMMYDVATQTKYWLWEQQNTAEKRYKVIEKLKNAKDEAEANAAAGLTERSGHTYQGLAMARQFMKKGWAPYQKPEGGAPAAPGAPGAEVAGGDKPPVNELAGTPQALIGHGPMDDVKGMIIHHTAGRGSVEGVLNTLRQRKLGSQFIIDREGNITQTMADGTVAYHMKDGWGPKGAGRSNKNMEGVEIIAKDDADVNEKQKAAALRLVAWRAKMFGYDPKTSTFGHGEVNPGWKQEREGMTVTEAVRAGAIPMKAAVVAATVAATKTATVAATAAVKAPGTLDFEAEAKRNREERSSNFGRGGLMREWLRAQAERDRNDARIGHGGRFNMQRMQARLGESRHASAHTVNDQRTRNVNIHLSPHAKPQEVARAVKDLEERDTAFEMRNQRAVAV